MYKEESEVKPVQQIAFKMVHTISNNVTHVTCARNCPYYYHYYQITLKLDSKISDRDTRKCGT